MRYLKTYEGFEPSKEMLDTLIICGDVLNDLSDEGFDVRTQAPGQFSVDNNSYITITKTDTKGEGPLKFFAGKFKWIEVKGTIQQLLSMIDDTCTYDIDFYNRFIAASPFYRDGTHLANYWNDVGRDDDNDGVVENKITDDTELGKIRIKLWYHPIEERKHFYKSKLF